MFAYVVCSRRVHAAFLHAHELAHTIRMIREVCASKSQHTANTHRTRAHANARDVCFNQFQSSLALESIKGSVYIGGGYCML